MKNETLECIEKKQEKSLRVSIFQSKVMKLISKGLIVTLPIVIIILLISVVFNLLLSIISPISNFISPGSGEAGIITHMITLTILIGIFYSIGVAVVSEKGRQYYSMIENEYLIQIPLYSTIKDLIHQFTDIQRMPFRKVVLIDPYNSGVMMTGFVTENIEGDLYTVFVPTAPNPTNGNIYHVPGSRLKFLDVNPEAAMRTIVGMGTGSSCLFPKQFIVEKEIQDVCLPINRKMA